MKAFQLKVTEEQLRSLASSRPTQLRKVVRNRNSAALPGEFTDVDLESGRARISPDENLTEIRARCQFAAGARVVTVSPRIMPGDVFWVLAPGRTREESRYTLDITGVHAHRIQDMTDADARADLLYTELSPPYNGQPPRRTFSLIWDVLGDGGWLENRWVWCFVFEVRRGQVDRLYPKLQR